GQELDSAIRWVKAQSAEFDAGIELLATAAVRDALALTPAAVGHGILVRDEGGAYLGAIPAERLSNALPDARLGDLVGDPLTALEAEELDGPRAAFDLMVAAGLEFAPVRRDGEV